MNPLVEKIREKGRNLIDGSTLWGNVPFIGGVALADEVVKDSLNPYLRFFIVMGSGVYSHRKAHDFFGTEAITEPGYEANFRAKKHVVPDNRIEGQE